LPVALPPEALPPDEDSPPELETPPLVEPPPPSRPPPPPPPEPPPRSGSFGVSTVVSGGWGRGAGRFGTVTVVTPPTPTSIELAVPAAATASVAPKAMM